MNISKGVDSLNFLFDRDSKKGQLTLFVIAGVVIVIAIVAYFLYSQDFSNNSFEGGDVIRDSLIECTKFTSKNSLYFVSYQGGYNEPPEKSFSFSPTFFPYYYYEGSNLMPSLQTFEREMASYVEENLAECFDSVKHDGVEVIYETPRVKVDIRDDGVEYKFNIPVTIRTREVSMRVDLSRYPVFYPSKLKALYEVSKMYVEDQVRDPEFYCITCLSDYASANGIRFYTFTLLDDVEISMAFEDSNNPLILNFVSKYSFSLR